MSKQSHKQIVDAVNELVRSVTSLVQSLEASVTNAAKAGARKAGGKTGGKTAGARRAKPGSARGAKIRTALKSHWASMTPQERADRVRRMLAGRGLEPKGDTARRSAASRSRKK